MVVVEGVDVEGLGEIREEGQAAAVEEVEGGGGGQERQRVEANRGEHVCRGEEMGGHGATVVQEGEGIVESGLARGDRFGLGGPPGQGDET